MAGSTPPASPPSGAGASRRRVLIIEDEADLAATLKYNLEQSGGLTVTVASTGEAGLALARQNSPRRAASDNGPAARSTQCCASAPIARPVACAPHPPGETSHIPKISLDPHVT